MVTRLAIGDLDPQVKDWMQRALDDGLRRDGRFRALVLRTLAPEEEVQPEANGVWQTRIVRRRRRHSQPDTEPTYADLDAAWRESTDPLPVTIRDYILRAAQCGLTFRAKQRERSVAGVQAKRQDHSRKDNALSASVRVARLRHPDYSRRAIALTLLSQHGRSGDREKAIDALAKRIARLDRRK
jgi:hypothetical protein